MNHLLLVLLGIAVVGTVFVALIIAAIVIFRRRSVGSGPPTPGSPNLLGTITQNKFARGLGIAVFLTVVYVLLLWLGYHFTSGALVRKLGIEPRWAFLLVTILGLPLIQVVWWLYGATGLPGDPKIIGRSFRTFAVFVLIFLGWWYHDQPNRSFNVENGKAIFYWAEEEGKPYFFDPGKGAVPKVYFSPATGETLRLGTPADAERFRKDSWLPKTVRGAKNLFHGPGISSAAKAAVGKTYEFPPGVNQITVPLSSDWGGWISTPPGSHWRISSSDNGWAEVKFLDGSRTKLVPREPTWFGIKSTNGSFRLRGEGGDVIVTLTRR